MSLFSTRPPSVDIKQELYVSAAHFEDGLNQNVLILWLVFVLEKEIVGFRTQKLFIFKIQTFLWQSLSSGLDQVTLKHPLVMLLKAQAPLGLLLLCSPLFTASLLHDIKLYLLSFIVWISSCLPVLCLHSSLSPHPEAVPSRVGFCESFFLLKESSFLVTVPWFGARVSLVWISLSIPYCLLVVLPLVLSLALWLC